MKSKKKVKSWPVVEILNLWDFVFSKLSIPENFAYYSFPNKSRRNKLLNVDKTVKMVSVENKNFINSRVPHVILGEIPESWLFASPQKFVNICKSLLFLAKHYRGPLDAMWPSLLGEIIAAELQVSGLFFVF